MSRLENGRSRFVGWRRGGIAGGARVGGACGRISGICPEAEDGQTAIQRKERKESHAESAKNSPTAESSRKVRQGRKGTAGKTKGRDRQGQGAPWPLPRMRLRFTRICFGRKGRKGRKGGARTAGENNGGQRGSGKRERGVEGATEVGRGTGAGGTRGAGERWFGWREGQPKKDANCAGLPCAVPECEPPHLYKSGGGGVILFGEVRGEIGAGLDGAGMVWWRMS